jgi:oligopeptide/dipeptide ABC transporter ATP-binding protein
MIISSPILEIKNLTVGYTTRSGTQTVVSDVNLEINRGEVLCLVGESGSGKSTLALATMGLLPSAGKVLRGSIIFDGTDVLQLKDDEFRKIRGKKMTMVFQDPMTSLNPVETVRAQMLEEMLAHVTKPPGAEAESMILRVMNAVRIGPERLRDFPHQLSGGMRQRVMIALALLLKPLMVIADEPTSSLDVLVEAQILDLVTSLKQDGSLTLLFITHNMGVVAQIADRVAVMYAGEIVEIGDVQQIFSNPLHPYTEALLTSVPNIKNIHREIRGLKGSPPTKIGVRNACPFVDRCRYAFERCSNEKPLLLGKPSGRFVSCHLRE